MKKICQKNIDLGKRLRKFRLEKRLTIDAIAKRIDVAPSTYREWESGRAITGNPYSELARELGVSVYQILGIEDQSRDAIVKYINEIERTIDRLKSLI